MMKPPRDIALLLRCDFTVFYCQIGASYGLVDLTQFLRT